MSISSKLGVTGIVGVFAAAMVVMYLSAHDPDSGDNASCDKNFNNNYSMSVIWKPGVLSIQNPVNIMVTVDGYPIVKRTRHVSPWAESMTACADVEVVLTSHTMHPSVHHMDCLILVNGNTVHRTGHDQIDGPGKVTCRA